LNIIVADDKKFIRLGLTAMLEEAFGEEVSVRSCRNGVDVAGCLKQESAGLLITDINMPGMDGIELMREAHKLAPGLQVIVVSGYDDFRYAQESIHHGARAYLLKPIDKDEFIAEVRAVIGQERERKRAEQKQSVYVRAVETMLSPDGPGNKETKDKASVIDAVPRALYSEDSALLAAFIERLGGWVNAPDADVVFLLLYQNCQSLGEIYVPDDKGFFAATGRYRDYLYNADYEACFNEIKPVLAKLRELMLDSKRRHCDKADIMYAISYIEKNFEKDINLDMAANAASLNYAYFSHVFKEYTGYGFTQYLTKLRVSRAAKYLADVSEASLKVYEIGRRVGFQSDKHFIRSFKKIMGLTPMEYRKGELLKKTKENSVYG
jgi:two-component system response regulator YesN